MITWENDSIKQMLLLLAFLAVLSLLSPYFGIELFFSSPAPTQNSQPDKIFPKQSTDLLKSRSSNTMQERIRGNAARLDLQPEGDSSFGSLSQVEELLKSRDE